MRSIYIICTLIFLILSRSATALIPDPVKEFDQARVLMMQDSLFASLGQNKIFDQDFLLPSLLALSYYPEFSQLSIQFKKKNIKTSMRSIPKFSSVLKNKSKRVYLINIDSKVDQKHGLDPAQLPFNAKVGILGHELAHISSYQTKSGLGLICTGIGYLFQGNRRRLERQADEIAINHGLGFQLIGFENYVYKSGHVDRKYLKFKKKYYFSPEQLIKLNEQHLAN